MLGTEDFLGDMDFKVAGTSEGVTAVQMDIKIEGVTPELMRRAIHQAKGSTPRRHRTDERCYRTAEGQNFRPTRHASTPYKSRNRKLKTSSVLGGKTVQGLQEETNTTINIGRRWKL